MPKGRSQETTDREHGWSDEQREHYQELMMSNQEQDELVDRSMGLTHEPLPGGGVHIHIGQDPAGDGLVNILPMFMPSNPHGFATAVELQDAGTYGQPKVPNPNLAGVLLNRQRIGEALDNLHAINKNWPLMMVIRTLEAMVTEQLLPEKYDMKNAAHALADVVDDVVTYMLRGGQ